MPGSGWMLFLSLALYGIALLSKETAIVFPAIIVVYAYFHFRRGVPGANNAAGQRVLGLIRALLFAVVAVLYLALRRIVLSGAAATRYFGRPANDRGDSACASALLCSSSGLAGKPFPLLQLLSKYFLFLDFLPAFIFGTDYSGRSGGVAGSTLVERVCGTGILVASFPAAACALGSLLHQGRSGT